jgi:outer membrane protein TolC
MGRYGPGGASRGIALAVFILSFSIVLGCQAWTVPSSPGQASARLAGTRAHQAETAAAASQNPPAPLLPAGEAAERVPAPVELTAPNSRALPPLAPESPSSGPAPAQPPAEAEEEVPPEPLQLTLIQAVAMGLERNLQLKIELINPLIEETRVMEALANFDSVLFANTSFQHRRSLLIAASALDPVTGAPVRDEERSESFVTAAGFRKPLTTGGTFVTQFSAQRYQFNVTGPTRQFTDIGFLNYGEWKDVSPLVMNPSVTTDLTFSLRQPLLRNAGTKVNEAAIDIARTGRQAARYDYEARTLSTIADVTQAYWTLVFQRELLTVRERSLKYARDLYEATARAVQFGTLPAIEVIRTKEAVAIRAADLILARAAVDAAVDRLRRLLRGSAEDVPDDQTIVPLDSPSGPHGPVDEKRAIYIALMRRSDFLAAKERAKADDTRLVVAKNQLLPLLDLGLSFNVNGLGGNLASSLGSKHHSPLNEVGIFHSDYYDATVAINLEWPVGDRLASSQYTRARLGKLSHLLQLKDMEEQVILEVREAIRAVVTSAERIGSTATARDLAAERLAAEQARYQAGAGRSLDVLEAQDQLDRAEGEALRARIDYHMALVALSERQGTLAEEFFTGSFPAQ